MLLYPNCKINIGLRVVRKREDGYHDLETIFYPVMGLHDELEVIPSSKFEFIQEGLAVDCKPEDNLIVKCFLNMKAKYPQIGNVRIRFKKNIPFGAGLGGGSSDAAHMAIALNKIFALGLTQEQLAEEVRPLGADCPFFIYNTPCYAEGIGDKLTPLQLDLSGLRLVMIKPACGVSTKEAYGGIQSKGTCEVLNDLKALKVINDLTILSALTNDFEETVCKIHPEIAEIKQRLLNAGAVYAAMSGSGSTVFGLFATPNNPTLCPPICDEVCPPVYRGTSEAEGVLLHTTQHNTERSSDSQLRLLHEEFASMIIFDDTLA